MGEMGHFGCSSAVQDFPQNHGRHIVFREGPILNPNRGGVCPILGIARSPPPEAINLALNLSNPYLRLAGDNGAILEAHWSPRIFLKIRENHRRPIAVWRGPF